MIDIIVNGKKRHVSEGELSYEEVVVLSLARKQAALLTVSYDGGDVAGTLVPGQRVALRDGMIFNVADTSAA